ncbi:hypothetical protein RHMOL_Rhmol02G0176900 [Rhododendron molle]|uniref:Uncharacterized protein n=1 Tax=Rhododendron molle TaxID=49168 RepID=A0ACC0PSQ7_RHOML|nr:hypothetical protein RHMOL_Rhmol02G0176900 [Rhododendron molle]
MPDPRKNLMDLQLKEKRKKQNIVEKFEMTHRRHRHGGEWINDKAREHHVLAIKVGVDPAQVQEVIDRCNSEAGTSDEEADAAGNSDDLNTLDEEDDKASISGMLVFYLAICVRLFRLGCCKVVQAVVLYQLLEGSNMWEDVPRTLCGVDDALVRQGNEMESLNVFGSCFFYYFL